MLALGKFEYQLDDKNRLRIPAKLKEGLGDDPIITAGHDGCLRLMTGEHGRASLLKLFEQTKNTEKGRWIYRAYEESLQNVTMDSQYRFILSKSLLDISKITKNVIFLSNGEFVELWSLELYNSRIEKLFNGNPIDLSVELGEYDI